MNFQKDKIEELLCKLAKDSDEKAFEQLFGIYYDRLLTAAFVIVKQQELAEEVVADVFLKIWNKRNTLGEVRNIDNYLFISVKNTALNYIAKEQKNKTISNYIENLDIDSGITQEDLIIADELRKQINYCINLLPSRCKQIFKMVRFEGLKYKEVAKKLNISVNTVDTQMGIALKKISKYLKDG